MSTANTPLTLYVNDHCPACRVVTDYIRRNNYDCRIYNVDRPEGEQPPVDVMVFPALFREDRLLAYGEDILRKLSSSRISKVS